MTPAGYRVVQFRWFQRDPYKRSALIADEVARFPDRDAAEADCQSRERAAWLDPAFNPFDYAGPLWYLSGLPDWALRDWVLDHGFIPPQKGRTWRRWYETKRPDPLLMREALGKLRLFAVEPVGATAWGAGELRYAHHWEDPRQAEVEGWNLRHAYPTRPAAEAMADAITESNRGAFVYPGPDEDLYSTEARDGRPGAFPRAEAAWAEVTPIDCPAGLPTGPTGWAVVRPPFHWAGVDDTSDSSGETGVCVPLALYPTEEQAAGRVRDLLRLAGRAVNPFAFFDVPWFTGDVLARVRKGWPGAPDQTAADPDRVAMWDAAQPGLDDDARAAVWAEIAGPSTAGQFPRHGRVLFEVQDVHWHAE